MQKLKAELLTQNIFELCETGVNNFQCLTVGLDGSIYTEARPVGTSELLKRKPVVYYSSFGRTLIWSHVVVCRDGEKVLDIEDVGTPSDEFSFTMNKLVLAAISMGGGLFDGN